MEKGSLSVTDEEYEALLKGEHRAPYQVYVITPQPVDVPRRLAACGRQFAAVGDDNLVTADGWSYSVGTVDWTGGAAIPLRSYLTSAEREAVVVADRALSFSCLLGAHPLGDVARLMVEIHTLCPEITAIRDAGAFVYRTGRWVAAVATGRPVRFTELFQVHVVADEEVAWAHSHGLARLGLVELEYIGESGDIDLAHRVVNSAAAALASGGLREPGEPFRINDNHLAQWFPWRSHEWVGDGLGGPGDRDDFHTEFVGIVDPPDADAYCTDEPAFDENGWVRYETVDPYLEEVRRTAQPAYEVSRARDDRTMWLTSGATDGTVVSLEDGVYTVLDTATTAEVRVPADAVERWGVATASGFCLGPYVAHELPLIEDVEQRWGAEPSGPSPVCAVCGSPPGGAHEGGGDESPDA
jgi:hypothetical protein